MKLTNTKESFERVYPYGEDPKPVFTLRKLSYADVASIQDSTAALDDSNKIRYFSGTTGRLKIKLSLVSWKNVTDSEGKEASCDEAHKENLPIDVARWLVNEIDLLNNLAGIPENERKN